MVLSDHVILTPIIAMVLQKNVIKPTPTQLVVRVNCQTALCTMYHAIIAIFSLTNEVRILALL